jgi:hypothetical protein
MVTTWAPVRQLTISLNAAIRAPRQALEARRLRSRLPTVDVSLKFVVYQQWQTAQARLMATGMSGGAEECVMAEVAAGSSPALALICPLYVEGAGAMHRPPFMLHVQGGESLLGMQAASLVPATPDSVLGTGYLKMLARAGFSVPERLFVHMAVNGSPWGLYVMEATRDENLARDAAIAAESVWITFDAAALRPAPDVVPEASFAYARPTLIPVDAIKPLDAADIPPEVPAGTLPVTAEARDLLTALERGDLLPSSVFDPDAIGQLIAANALWYGVPFLDWQTLGLLYDPANGRFAPWVSGLPPNPRSPLPAGFTDDPAIHRATTRCMETYSDPAVLSLDELEVLYTALGGAPDGLHTRLAQHQVAMRARVAPARTLFASVSTEDGAIRLELYGIVPYPVEVMGLDFGARGAVHLDPAWTADGSAVLDDSEAVVLRARVGADPVQAVVRIPLVALPEAANIGSGTVAVLTRLLGGSNVVRVPVDVGSVVRR